MPALPDLLLWGLPGVNWSDAKLAARAILDGLRARHNPHEIKQIIEALSREHRKERAMQQPQIIIAEPKPGSYTVTVSGRFGGGFQNLKLDRAGVLSRLAHLKSYDCGDEPAAVIIPESLRPEFEKVFPKSFSK